MTVIRLSPSGPPIQNDAGQEADVGEGFRLRVSEIHQPQPTTQAVTTTHIPILRDGGLAEIFVTLDLPGEESQYRIEAECWARCTASGICWLEIMTDDGDGGAQTQRVARSWSMVTDEKHVCRARYALAPLPLGPNPPQLIATARFWFASGAGSLIVAEPASIVIEECL